MSPSDDPVTDEHKLAPVAVFTPGSIENVSLRLELDQGEEYVFVSTGPTPIHLVGHLVPPSDDEVRVIVRTLSSCVACKD